MKKIYYSLLVIIAAGCIYYLYNSTEMRTADCKPNPISFINPDFEIDPRFLITPEKEIIFSANNSHFFSLYQYKNEIITSYDSLSNVMYPFLFKGKAIGLQDQEGNEKYLSTDSSFNALFDNNHFQSVFSFNKGILLVVKLKNDNQVIILDLQRGSRQILLPLVQTLHTVSYSEKHNFIIANYDSKLVFIDLNKNDKIIELASNAEGNKMNPYVYGQYVYFVNNSDSEYFKVYGIDLSHEILKPQLIHQTNYDIKIPKYDGETLYYIEIINSEYLLRRLNLTSGRIDKITQTGVIYNYEFYDDRHILYAYTDFITPKSLILYDKGTDSFANLTSKNLQLNIKYDFMDKTDDRSSAYLFSPINEDKPKGIVLFFHPGLHSDFSPRWDPILSNLAANGFIILAPNYPMSSGFGKSFYNASFNDALKDIKKWKDFITKEYDRSPLYYLSASSGNILMEYALMNNNKKVRASASLFGIPATDELNPYVPNLFIMGENDPIIDFKPFRMKLLTQQNNTNISVVSYENEGHWFRKSQNIQHALQQVIDHFCDPH